MPDKTAIEWTDATWNPVHGCSKVSPGCAHCYAETLSLRYGFTKLPWTPDNATANVQLHPERLAMPLKWKEPRRIFVNSVSDLFHELVPDEFICKVFTVMRRADWHIFQVLTKRMRRMLSFMRRLSWHSPETGASGLEGYGWQAYLGEKTGFIPPNIQLGTSVENQRVANERIPLLLETPAAVRFLSCEPLLGPVDLDPFLWEEAGPAWAGQNIADPGLDWVIAGGESGAKHRPIDPDWVRNLQLQCQIAGVPFFFKQWGGKTPKSGGDLLDGVQYHEFPQVVSHV